MTNIHWLQKTNPSKNTPSSGTLYILGKPISDFTAMYGETFNYRLYKKAPEKLVPCGGLLVDTSGGHFSRSLQESREGDTVQG